MSGIECSRLRFPHGRWDQTQVPGEAARDNTGGDGSGLRSRLPSRRYHSRRLLSRLHSGRLQRFWMRRWESSRLQAYRI